MVIMDWVWVSAFSALAERTEPAESSFPRSRVEPQCNIVCHTTLHVLEDHNEKGKERLGQGPTTICLPAPTPYPALTASEEMYLIN